MKNLVFATVAIAALAIGPSVAQADRYHRSFHHGHHHGHHGHYRGHHGHYHGHHGHYVSPYHGYHRVPHYGYYHGYGVPPHAVYHHNYHYARPGYSTGGFGVHGRNFSFHLGF